MNNYHRKCPVIIDIEASGFGPDSYPIEVGVITDEDSSYCRLIRPQAHWTHWDRQAQQIHGIERSLIMQFGHPPSIVAQGLNQLLKGKTAYSDGWVVDKPWLIRLFEAADMEMQFSVSPIEVLLTEAQMEIWSETKQDIIRQTRLKRHRASADARIIQQTYLRTLALGRADTVGL